MDIEHKAPYRTQGEASMSPPSAPATGSACTKAVTGAGFGVREVRAVYRSAGMNTRAGAFRPEPGHTERGTEDGSRHRRTWLRCLPPKHALSFVFTGTTTRSGRV